MTQQEIELQRFINQIQQFAQVWPGGGTIQVYPTRVAHELLEKGLLNTSQQAKTPTIPGVSKTDKQQ